MKSGTRKNLNRRARKILSRVKKLGEKDTLLDLTPLDEQEKEVFLPVPDPNPERTYLLSEIAKAVKHLGNLRTNGSLQGNKIHKAYEGQIVGLRFDTLIIGDLLNYPLTDAEKTLSLLSKETEDK